MRHYIFDPSTGQIGIPNGDAFYFFKNLAYSKDVPVPVVMSDGVKVETEVTIVAENNQMDFSALGNRIKVDLTNR